MIGITGSPWPQNTWSWPYPNAYPSDWSQPAGLPAYATQAYAPVASPTPQKSALNLTEPSSPATTRLASRNRTSFSDEGPSEPLLGSIQRLYNYLSPTQAVGLFTAGMAASFATGWVFRELGQLRRGKGFMVSFEALRNKAQHTQQQTGVFFTEGIPAIAMMAIKDPEVRSGLMAYMGASAMGYAAGSAAQGVQEVAIRREETQIRADLLTQMTTVVKASMDHKIKWDRWHRGQTKRRLEQLLTDHGVPNASQLLDPVIPHSKPGGDNRLHRYLFEPTHLSQTANGATAVNFGLNRVNSDMLPDPNPIKTASEPSSIWQQHVAKVAMFSVGLVSGLIGQGLFGLLKRATLPPPNAASGAAFKMPTNMVLEVFNIYNWEALFLQGNRHLLLACIGLAAAGKLGKILIDGYREVEVTRQHAETELRYQRYNWLNLDTQFHRTAEMAATNEAITRLNDDMPSLMTNRGILHQRVQLILDNIGRNSAPKYFPMTPMVGLREARS